MLGMDCEMMRWDDGGAIIIAGFECVQLTVGSRVPTVAVLGGMTTIYFIVDGGIGLGLLRIEWDP